MTKHRTRTAAPVSSKRPLDPSFDPVATQRRHDGWTPERQADFIAALSECGCVDEACKRVGMGTSSAYALRRRRDAQSFRLAWDAALDVAIERLADAAFARAIKGVATPVFYKGEQVGERVRHDERLTMFLLRYRDPARYGAWVDRCAVEQEADGAAATLAQLVDRIAGDTEPHAPGVPPPARPPLAVARRFVSPAEQALAVGREAAARRAREDAMYRATPEETDAAILKALAALDRREAASRADVACGSSTSDPGPAPP